LFEYDTIRFVLCPAIPPGYVLVIGRGNETAAPPSVSPQPQEHPMKTLIASTLVALGLLASAAGAAPYDTASRGDVPQWAQKALAGSRQ
jgi:hypothetical protein